MKHYKQFILNMLFAVILICLSSGVWAQAGNALNFDGISNQVNIPGTAQLSLQNNSFTIEAWINGSDFSNEIPIIGCPLEWNYSFQVSIRNSHLFLGFWGDDTEGTTVLNTNTWYHIAFTFDLASGTQSLYLNGVLDVASVGHAPYAYDKALAIGYSLNTVRYFNGTIDELRFWNVARSQADIQSTMSAPLVGNEAGLVAYYNFDEGTAGGTNTGLTTLNDITGNNNNGTLVNFALTGSTSNWVTSGAMTLINPKGNALAFDGVDDYVFVNPAPVLPANNNYTLEALINTTSPNQQVTILGFGNAGDLKSIQFRVGFGKLEYGIFDGSAWEVISSNASVNDGNWHHVAATRSGNTVSLYIDGVLDINGTFNNLAQTSTMVIGNLWINGAISTEYGGYSFQGKIDEVRIWNVARSQADIQANMSNYLTMPQTGLLAYYRFDQGIAGGDNTGLPNQVIDYTGNCNNGTLHNFTLNGSTSNWVATGNDAAPIVSTVSGTMVTPSTVVLVGNIIAIGGSSITDYGFLLHNADCPTFQNTGKSFMTGDVFPGTILSTISGMSPNTTYYYRTYAINAQGASYGEVQSFTTPMTPPGNALSFDGVKDYISIPNNASLNPTNALTIEAWVNTNSQNDQIIAHKWANGYQYALQIVSQELYFVIYNGTSIVVVSPTKILTNTWVHCAAVFDGTSLFIYENGILKNSVNYGSTTISSGTGNLTIGTRSDAPGEYFSGKMDEVRIWNVARTQADIQSTMFTPLAGTETGLVAYYNFDEGVADGTNTGVNTLTDITSNANNGTLYNFNLTGTTSNWVASGAMPAAATLGNYADASVMTGGSIAVISNPAPTNAVSMTAKASNGFGGTIAVNPANGYVIIENPRPAGTYLFTVTAFSLQGNVVKTFNLTVTNPYPTIYTTPNQVSVGTTPSSVAVGDFNNDAHQDLVITNSGSNNVSIKFGDGAGGFSGTTVLNASQPSAVAVGDFNGDGNEDIAFANYDIGTVSIRLGDGAGNFSGTTELTVGTNPVQIQIGDFNNDNIADLAVVNSGSNNVSILFGDGTGNFSNASNFTVGSLPKSVAIGDFNNDNNLDFTTADYTSQTSSIQYGDGTGLFNLFTNFGGGRNFTVVGDFNKDGNLDYVVSGNTATGTFVKVYTGDGTGVFTQSSSINFGKTVNEMVVGDFNGDGNLDVAVCSTNSIEFLLGDGTGGFTLGNAINLGFTPKSLAVGDFNYDGLEDLVTLDPSNGAVVYMGQFPTPLPPVAAAATYISASGFTANWNAAIGASGYYLDVATDAGFTSMTSGYINLDVGNVTKYNVTGLDPTNTYYYQVRAYNGQGTSASSNSITVQTSMTPPGNALAFSGANDYVSVNNPNLGTNNVTVEAWINATAWGTSYWDGTIVGSDAPFNDANTGYVLRCGGGGALSFARGDGNVSWPEVISNPIMVTGEWIHVAGVFDGSTMKIYIDGNLQNTVTTTTPLSNANPSLFIGASPYNNARFFNGMIDEVRIWNVARTQADIQANMLTPLVGNEAGLVAYYNFDQGIAGGYNIATTMLPDVTTNGNNGTLYGFGLNGTVSNWVTSEAMTLTTPNAPTTTVTNVTDMDFTVSWNSLFDASTYTIDVATDEAFTQNLNSYTGITNTYFDITGLSPSTLYYYRVTGVNVGGAGNYSNTVSVMTSAPPPIPQAPVANDATNIFTTGFTANWNYSTDAATYSIDVATDIDFNNIVYNVTQISYLYASPNGLNPATTYYYRITAVNETGASDYSNIITVTTTSPINTFPYTQNFTAWPPANWDLSGGTFSWIQYTNNAAYADFWNNQEPNNALMKTPVFDFSNLTSPTLTYNWSHLYDPGYPDDELDVEISTDGINWTLLEKRNQNNFNSKDGALDETPGSYVTSTINLKPYAGYSSVQIRFNGISGFGPDVFINNVTIYQPVSNALSFNGTDNFVNEYVIPYDFGNSFTFEAWIKTTGTSESIYTEFGANSSSVFSTNSIYIDANGILTYSNFSNGTINGLTVINDGNWHHIAVIQNTTTSNVNLLVDGNIDTNPASTQNGTFTLLTTSNWTGMGYPDGGAATNYYSGLIDEVRIWNTALSYGTIRNQMYNVVPANSKGLVSYYNFDQTSGTNLPDLINPTNNGFVNGSNIPGCWVESMAMVVPTNLVITDAQQSSFSFAWTPPQITNFDKFSIDVATDSLFTNMVAGYNNVDVGNVTSYTVNVPTGLYYYRVRAVSLTDGIGANSRFDVIDMGQVYCGTYNSDVTFNAPKIIIVCPITINAALTIMQGTTIQFLNQSYINCQSGQIYANGTSDGLITFTGTADNFQGIYLGGGYKGKGKPNKTGPIFTYCNFVNGNSAYSESGGARTFSGNGGAIYSDGVYIDIDHSTFTNCYSDDQGGGAIYVNNGGVNLTNSTFITNTTLGNGGSVYLNYSDATIDNNIFKNNQAGNGGAIYNTSPYSFYVDNNIFDGNSAIYTGGGGKGGKTKGAGTKYGGGYGGAIYTSDANEINKNIFRNNSAGTNGGACNLDGNIQLFSYNIVALNNTAGGGGGLYLSSTNSNIFNNTFYANSDSYGGGGIYIGNGGMNLIQNNIFDKNVTNGEGTYFDDITSYYDYSLVNNYLYSGYNGNQPSTEINNIYNGDLHFLNESSSDFHLTECSPAVNTGDNTGYEGLLPTTDFDGNPNIYTGGTVSIIDLGVYEFAGNKLKVNAGIDETLCQDTFTLAASKPLYNGSGNQTSGVWSANTNVTFDNTANYNAFISNIPFGVNTVKWTVTRPTCFAADSIMITNNKVPFKPLVDAMLCTNYSILDADPLTIPNTIGVWSIVGAETAKGSKGYPTAIIADMYNPNSPVTNLAMGNNLFVWSASSANSPGCVHSDTVNYRNEQLDTMYAGNNYKMFLQDLTDTAGVYQLQGLQSPVGTGKWTLISGVATIVSDTLYNTWAHGFGFGSNYFQWQITTNCGIFSAQVDIARGVFYQSQDGGGGITHWSDLIDWFPHGIPTPNDSVVILPQTKTLVANDPSTGCEHLIVVGGANVTLQLLYPITITNIQILPGTSLTIDSTLMTKGSAPNFKTSSITVEPETSKTSAGKLTLSTGSSITVEPETSKGTAPGTGNVNIGAGGSVTMGKGSSITVEPETSKGSTTTGNVTFSSNSSLTMGKGSSITVEPETSKIWLSGNGNIFFGDSMNILLDSAKIVINKPKTKASADNTRNINVGSGSSVTLNKGSSITVEPETSKQSLTTGVITLDPNTSIIDYNDHDSINALVVANLLITKKYWHYISSPMQHSDISPYLGTYFDKYDEPSHNWMSLDYFDTLQIMRGYAILYKQNDTLLHIPGYVNTGTLSMNNLTYNISTPLANPQYDGWHLLGNPYPSSIDWDSIYNRGKTTNIGSAIYCWDPLISNYTYYTPGSPGLNGGSNIVPPLQGFFVKLTSAPGSLILDNSVRTHARQPFFKSDVNPDMILLKATGNNFSDEMLVKIDQSATDGFDGRFDAVKRFVDFTDMKQKFVPQLYSLDVNKNEMAINVLPMTSNEKIIPVNFKAGTTGIYNIALTQFTISSKFNVVFIDNALNKTFDMKKMSSYDFSYSVNDDPSRFEIVLKNAASQVNQINNNDCAGDVNIFSSNKNIYISVPCEQSLGEVHVYDLLGREVFSSLVNTVGLSKFVVAKNAGCYIVKMVNSKKITTTKVYLNN